MGVYEKEEFRNGTSKLIEFIASLTSSPSQTDVITIAAGGDTSSG
jgi:3-phosphoglycerate kinase